MGIQRVRTSPALLFARLLYLLFFFACSPERERIILATTTSIEDSGLLDSLATSFNQTHPRYILAPVAAGTGMVLEIGRRKDADVLVTHDSVGEMNFVAQGYGHTRRHVMQNDFIIVGPGEDPANIRGQNALQSLQTLSQGRIPFVSRADDSGTHRREMRLWQEAGVRPDGDWYIQAGVGMGDALLLAGQKRAYILTDRATYKKFRKRVNLEVMIDGDPPLLNRYSVIIVRDARNETGGKAFADWLVGNGGRSIIRQFGTSQFGEPLFVIGDEGDNE